MAEIDWKKFWLGIDDMMRERGIPILQDATINEQASDKETVYERKYGLPGFTIVVRTTMELPPRKEGQ